MQWVEAEKWIAVALEEEPLSAPAHYLRGLILLERSQPEAALAALRNCVFADAEFVMGHVALADLLVKQGQPERARKALESAGRLAAARPTNEAIPEGDGVTAGGLLEMINLRKSQL
jgi:chemotaxis protein methyltransferase CheR